MRFPRFAGKSENLPKIEGGVDLLSPTEECLSLARQHILSGEWKRRSKSCLMWCVGGWR